MVCIRHLLWVGVVGVGSLVIVRVFGLLVKVKKNGGQILYTKLSYVVLCVVCGDKKTPRWLAGGFGGFSWGTSLKLTM